MKCAFDRTVYCIALMEKQCRGCSFRKTPEELDAGREKAEDRIASLPEEQQDHIRKKYRAFNVSARVWTENRCTEGADCSTCENCYHDDGYNECSTDGVKE